jgi:hypothetical protein
MSDQNLKAGIYYKATTIGANVMARRVTVLEVLPSGKKLTTTITVAYNPHIGPNSWEFHAGYHSDVARALKTLLGTFPPLPHQHHPPTISRARLRDAAKPVDPAR